MEIGIILALTRADPGGGADEVGAAAGDLQRVLRSGGHARQVRDSHWNTHAHCLGERSSVHDCLIPTITTTIVPRHHVIVIAFACAWPRSFPSGSAISWVSSPKSTQTSCACKKV